MSFCTFIRAHSLFAFFGLSLFTFFRVLSSPPALRLNNIDLRRRQLHPPPISGSSSTGSSASSTSSGISQITASLPPGGPIAPSASSTVSSSSSSFSSSVSPSKSVSLIPSTTTSTPTLAVPTPAASTSTLQAFPISSSTTLTDAPTPSTTFMVEPADSSTTTSSADPSSTPTSVDSSSSGSQFWQNKGAVAATFTLSILVALALVAVLVVYILKKRNARIQALIDAEFLPHYQDPRSRASSPDPSVHESPMDPFNRREVTYDHVLPNNVSIPLSSQSAPVIPAVHISPPSFIEPLRFTPPSQSQTTPEMSTASRNRLQVRTSTQSGYQPSVDSFYGAYSPTR